MNGAFNKSRHL